MQLLFILMKRNYYPQLIQLTEYVEEKIASKLESYYLEEYKKNNWNILNTVKGGGLGGNFIKWNYSICENEALKYNSYSEMKKESPNIYNKIIKSGWCDELCGHFKEKEQKIPVIGTLSIIVLKKQKNLEILPNS